MWLGKAQIGKKMLKDTYLDAAVLSNAMMRVLFKKGFKQKHLYPFPELDAKITH